MQKQSALNNHIMYRSGKQKTTCVTTILVALGIPEESFKVTWNKTRNIWRGILQRNGFSTRSRTGRIPRTGPSVGGRRRINITVGSLRCIIRNKMAPKDPANVMYIIEVPGHILLLSNEGRTLVDTAPRQRDNRKVVGVTAIFRNSNSVAAKKLNRIKGLRKLGFEV